MDRRDVDTVIDDDAFDSHDLIGTRSITRGLFYPPFADVVPLFNIQLIDSRANYAFFRYKFTRVFQL